MIIIYPLLIANVLHAFRKRWPELILKIMFSYPSLTGKNL